MSHARQQIRDAVVVLVTGLTTTTTNVFPSRSYTLAGSNLPCLLVYTENEVIDEEEGKISQLQFRTLDILIVGIAQLTASLDDKLDTILAEVETALFADRFIGNRVTELDLVEVETEIVTDESEVPTGQVMMRFRVQYLTEEGSPETIAT